MLDGEEKKQAWPAVWKPSWRIPRFTQYGHWTTKVTTLAHEYSHATLLIWIGTYLGRTPAVEIERQQKICRSNKVWSPNQVSKLSNLLYCPLASCADHCWVYLRATRSKSELGRSIKCQGSTLLYGFLILLAHKPTPYFGGDITDSRDNNRVFGKWPLDQSSDLLGARNANPSLSWSNLKPKLPNDVRPY